MNIDEITSFLAVANSNSMSEAAMVLHITQPTLSNRIFSLEETVGGTLFVRGKGQKQVVLTELGKHFLLVAERWQTLWLETTSLASTMQKKSLRVTTGKTSGIYIMPQVYHRFFQRGLPVDLSVAESAYLESFKLVENKDADLAIVSKIIAHKEISVTPFFSERMVFLCSKSSQYDGIIHPDSLDPRKCVDTDWSIEYQKWYRSWFGSQKSHIRCTDLRLCEEILSHSDYWALSPLSVANAMAKTSRVRYLELAESAPPRTMYLVTLTPHNPYLDVFMEDLLAVMHELSPSGSKANPEYMR